MVKKDTISITHHSVLSAQDVLIAYCSTLSEERAKRAYKMLREEFEVDRSKMVRLNKYGNVDDSGLIRMTTRQYNKMLKECGEYKFHWLVDCVYGYVEFVKGQADAGDARAKKQYKLYTTVSCYPKLMKGWVMDRYKRDATPPPESMRAGSIDFYSIDCERKALEYISSLPQDLLVDSSPEIEFLSTRYPKVLEYIQEELK